MTTVRVATTTNGNLATDFENNDTIDGITLATGDIILIKDQTTPSENGIYEVQASGAPNRAHPFRSGQVIEDLIVSVNEGDTQELTQWQVQPSFVTNTFGQDVEFTKIVTPSFYFCAYGPSTSIDITAGFTPITFDTQIRADSAYTHSTVTNPEDITINTAGDYLITFNFTGDLTAGGTRSGTVARLTVNGGEVTGTRCYGYHRNTATGENTCSTSIIQTLAASDIINVEAFRISGPSTVVALANATRIVITKI